MAFPKWHLVKCADSAAIASKRASETGAKSDANRLINGE
jgi:hypothetical protein